MCYRLRLGGLRFPGELCRRRFNILRILRGDFFKLEFAQVKLSEIKLRFRRFVELLRQGIRLPDIVQTEGPRIFKIGLFNRVGHRHVEIKAVNQPGRCEFRHWLQCNSAGCETVCDLGGCKFFRRKFRGRVFCISLRVRRSTFGCWIALQFCHLNRFQCA